MPANHARLATMSRPIRRVAVIGTGPAGAIATDALVKEQAFEVVRVFERKHQAGGTWVYDAADGSSQGPAHAVGIPSVRALLDGTADLPVDLPPALPAETPVTPAVNSVRRRYADSGAYADLHSNLPPQHMAFTQEPLPAAVSARSRAQYGPDAPFRHRAVVRQWVEDLFRRGGHLGRVVFGTTVERVEKQGGAWVLTLRREAPSESEPGQRVNRWWQETFDAVVVASGRYALPYLPPVPGLAAYAARFPGRVVHSKHFRGAAAFADKTVVVVGGSVSAFDALHGIRRVARTPVLASLREPLPAFGWGAFVHPHVQIRPPIARVHADGPDAGRVEFADGSAIAGGDDVVLYFATGYDVSFPFLPDFQTTRIRNRRICGLYLHVFNIADPSLVFLGMVSRFLVLRSSQHERLAEHNRSPAASPSAPSSGRPSPPPASSPAAPPSPPPTTCASGRRITRRSAATASASAASRPPSASTLRACAPLPARPRPAPPAACCPRSTRPGPRALPSWCGCGSSGGRRRGARRTRRLPACPRGSCRGQSQYTIFVGHVPVLTRASYSGQ